MKSVGIICKKGRPEPAEILQGFVPWLRGRGIEVLMAPQAAQSVARSGIDVNPCPGPEMADRADMAVVLGGDGTMLGAARLLAGKGVPILGVNLGELGFITEVASHELLEAMQSVLEGKCQTEERTMLKARIDSGTGESAQYYALNDILVTRGSTPRIIALEATVDGRFVNTFRADGIVVATPTGSTAYSLSADGPILFPTLESLVMTPICPHTLTNRPIVLPDGVTIRITLKSEEEAMVMHDGLVAGSIKAGQTIVIEKSPFRAKLIMPPGRDHFSVLRSKLGWGGM